MRLWRLLLIESLYSQSKKATPSFSEGDGSVIHSRCSDGGVGGSTPH